MPFKSEKQRRYMHANLPEIAQRWERDYASGGIARVGYQQGMGVAPVPPNPMLTNMQKMKPLALDVMTGQHMPGISPHYGGYGPIDQWGNIQMDLEKDDIRSGAQVQEQPAWYNRMFNKAGEGIRGIKNKFTEGWDSSKNFANNILDNTLMAKLMAGFDATNEDAFNYNPALRGQIDFMKGQGKYGVMDPSGLNKITGGALRGKNLQSMFGSNDLTTMFDKSIAQTQKTIDNFANQWGNLKEEEDEGLHNLYTQKLQVHLNRLAQKKKEQKEYFDSLQKKVPSGDPKKNWITKKTSGGNGGGGPGPGGGDTASKGSGAKAGTTGSWTPGGTYNAPSGHNPHRYAEGGLASLWPR